MSLHTGFYSLCYNLEILPRNKFYNFWPSPTLKRERERNPTEKQHCDLFGSYIVTERRQHFNPARSPLQHYLENCYGTKVSQVPRCEKKMCTILIQWKYLHREGSDTVSAIYALLPAWTDLIFGKEMLWLLLSTYLLCINKQASIYVISHQSRKVLTRKRRKRFLLKGEHNGNHEYVVKIRTRSVGLIGEIEHTF